MIKIWAILFWLVVWQLASLRLNQRILLVSPIDVVLRLSKLVGTIKFWQAILFTFSRITIGFLSSTALAVLLASIACQSKRVEELLAPIVIAMKSIPVASFIILALIFFSSKNLSILISFLIVFPIIYTSVLTGINEIDNKLLEMARVFNISGYLKIRYIYLPQVFPYFIAACQSALGMSWKSGVAAEVIGMPTGSIGERLQQAKIYLNTSDLFAWTLVIIIVSLIFEKIFIHFFKWLSRRLEIMN